MAGRNFFPRCVAFELQIYFDSIGIRLKSAMHLGKKFLAAIFSVIVYSVFAKFAALEFGWFGITNQTYTMLVSFKVLFSFKVLRGQTALGIYDAINDLGIAQLLISK